jgi:O-antigen/teichoic acid export membrane protein
MKATLSAIKSMHHYLALEGFSRYLKNTGWLFFARIANLITSFFILAIVARYLGPSNYGLLSYAISFTGLFAFIATLGLDQILFRDLVKHPDKHYVYMGTAFYLRLMASFVTFVCTLSAAILLKHDQTTIIIIALMSSAFFFNSFSLINYEFQARVLAKYTSIGTVVVALLLSLLKLVVIFFDKGIIYFSLIFLAEGILSMLMFVYCYHKIGRDVRKWQFDSLVARQLLNDSWPLILTAGLTFLYTRIDQVMIQHYINETGVGLYDAAVRIAEIWYFIPLLIVNSVFPSIINSRASDLQLYKRRLRDLIIIVIAIALIFSAPIFLIADNIMGLVFGSAYLEGATVLAIYVWAGLGLTLTATISQALIAENKTKFLFLISFFGAFLNIVCNIFLIPKYGINGAAIATLISYIVTSIVITGYFYLEIKRQHP